MPNLDVKPSTSMRWLNDEEHDQALAFSVVLDRARYHTNSTNRWRN